MVKPLQYYLTAKVATLLFFALLIAGVSACQKQSAQQETKGFGSIVGANYTSDGIQAFSVDGAWGGNIFPHSGGGSFVCCASYPKQWASTLKVLIQWRRSDGRDAQGQWRIKSLEQAVAIEKYYLGGDIYVLFLPGDTVKVFVSAVGLTHPQFPSHFPSPEAARKGVK